MSRSQLRRAPGYSLVELMLVMSVFATIAGLSVPMVSSTIEEIRAAAASRHVAARLAALRLEAVRRSSTVGLKFERQGSDYAFTPFLDGNGNGLRATDVSSGSDLPLGRTERLNEHFADTSFGLLPGIPDLDGASGNPSGVRIGSTAFLSMSPNGSCTGGTLYVHGRRSQFAVRILGATGRVRFFRYDTGGQRWMTR
jgi:prepilin-type N-terminal cleavage/methylation domain-containing protein